MKKSIKKVSLFIVVMFLAVFFVACNANTTIEMDNPSAWAYLVSETTEYKITKYTVDTNIVVATGTLTMTVQYKGPNFDSVYTELELNHLDTPQTPEIDKGATDTVTSYAEFLPSSMFPIKSHKTVTLDDRYNDDGTTQPNPSYDIEANYGDSTQETVAILKDNEGKEVSKLNIGNNDGRYSDNEYLYYTIRNSNSIIQGKTVTFNLSVLYDSLNAKKFYTHPMKLTVGNNLKAIKLADNTGIDVKNNENNTIDTFETGLDIDSEDKGPTILAYYSSQPVYIDEGDNAYIADKKANDKDKQANKVLIKIQTSEYNLEKKIFLTDFELIKYSAEAIKSNP